MKDYRRKILLITIGAILFLAAPGSLQSQQVAVDEYREAYIALQEALKLRYENRTEEALKQYEKAGQMLRNLLERFPDTNRETIETRLAKCEEAIEELKRDTPIKPPVTKAMTQELLTSPPPEPETEETDRETKKIKKEVEDLKSKLKSAKADLEKARAEKAITGAELKETKSEIDRLQREAQNINTSLSIAITDLKKEREGKAKIEEDAVIVQQASEEILKSQLAQALADKKKTEEEAMQAYLASEEIMRDQMEKQKQENLKVLEAERMKIDSEKKAAAQPIEKFQSEIDIYRQQIEKASRDLNESLKILASSQETYRKLLETNRVLEKRIAALSKSVSERGAEAELTELQRIASAEEDKLKKPDITRVSSLPKKSSPMETKILVGKISEKNDEYGKVFIDYVQKIEEGEELVVIRDNETIAKLKVSKVFPSIKGGIANVIPKEDAYELREKDELYAIRHDSKKPL